MGPIRQDLFASKLSSRELTISINSTHWIRMKEPSDFRLSAAGLREKLYPFAQMLTLSLFLMLPAQDLFGQPPAPPASDLRPDAARVAEIASWLAGKAQGVGPMATQKEEWQKLAHDAWFQMKLENGKSAMETALPELTPELYRDFSTKGDRSSFEKPLSLRIKRLNALAVTACLAPSDSTMAELEKEILYQCNRPTWVLPAHDRALRNFHGEEINIDLGSSLLAWELAEIHHLLGAKLSESTRHRIEERVHAFVLDPFAAMVRGERKADGWLTVTNNWNAVCLSGVLGSALALIDDRNERALFVAAAEKLSLHFLEGFGRDGYCSEGLGYWNYGFGHYTQLCETIRAATNDKLDLLARPQSKLAAGFPSRVHILNGIYPAFSDAPVDVSANSTLLRVLRKRLPDLTTPPEKGPAPVAYASITEAMLFAPLAADEPATVSGATAPRDWFPDAGVLIVRPRPEDKWAFGAAIKGGNNDENHNHNDLGSFVVVAGNVAELIDPGKETYTARTFSAHRYDSDVLNSYGHSVPVVAGKLQEPGRQRIARVLEQASSAEEERLRLDLSAAYDVKELQKLERSFVFHRGREPSLVLEDRVKFGTPQKFETALVLPPEATIERQESGAMVIRVGASAVRIEIAADGGEIVATEAQLKDGIKPKRVAFTFKDSLTSGSIRITIRPVAKP